jgi:hypothetical protein
VIGSENGLLLRLELVLGEGGYAAERRLLSRPGKAMWAIGGVHGLLDRGINGVRRQG